MSLKKTSTNPVIGFEINAAGERVGTAAVLTPRSFLEGMPPGEAGQSCMIVHGQSAKDVLKRSIRNAGGAHRGWVNSSRKFDVVIFSGTPLRPEDPDRALVLAWPAFARPSDASAALKNRVHWMGTTPSNWEKGMCEILRAEWPSEELIAEGDDEADDNAAGTPPTIIVVWPLEILMPGRAPRDCAEAISTAALGYSSVLIEPTPEPALQPAAKPSKITRERAAGRPNAPGRLSARENPTKDALKLALSLLTDETLARFRLLLRARAQGGAR